MIYDLDAAEAQMRADIAQAKAEGMQLVQEGGDADFLRAQRLFDEARIQFTLSLLRCENAGIDRNRLLAGGAHSIGSMWASLLLGAVGERERGLVNGWVQQSLMQHLGESAGAETISSMFKPEKTN